MATYIKNVRFNVYGSSESYGGATISAYSIAPNGINKNSISTSQAFFYRGRTAILAFDLVDDSSGHDANIEPVYSGGHTIEIYSQGLRKTI